MPFDDVILAIIIFAFAMLYSSVGHGGASGYLAAMALVGISPDVMRPTALTLNIFVASIATVKYFRVGAFSWHLFWPFALTSVPLAFLGGSITLPGHFYMPLVGFVLLFAAWRSFSTSAETLQSKKDRPPLLLLLFSGGCIGLLSGLTGVGGGIFLSPLLLLFRWADIKVISGIAAAFILVNSSAGLLGVISADTELPASLPYWVIAAIAGGFIGSEYGSKRLGNPTIKKLLAGVLIIAGLKMIFTGG